MKKLTLLLAVAILLACGAERKEVIVDPIFPQNFIQYGEDGKKSYIIADPIFPGNFLVFPEPE